MNYRYISFLIISLLALTACRDDWSNDLPERSLGGELVTMQIGVSDGDLRASTSDVMPMPSINSIEVWVFDQNGFLLEKAPGYDLSSEIEGAGRRERQFKVQIHSSSQARRVHVIANYSITDELFDSMRGLSESYVFSSLRLKPEDVKDNNIPMWGLKEMSSINEGDRIDNVRLIPSVARLSLEFADGFDHKLNSDASVIEFKPEGYTVYNTKTEGTIAPFKLGGGNKLSFVYPDVSGSVTEVPGRFKSDIPQESDFVALNKDILLFDQSNDPNIVDTFPSIILKAKMKWQETTSESRGASTIREGYRYFKLDIVHIEETNYIRYDIVRSKGVRVRIKEVDNTNAGSETIEDAVNSLPANNIALTPELLASNIIDDETSRLSVARVFWVLRKRSPGEKLPGSHGQDKPYEGMCWVNYFPEKSKDTGMPLFDKMENRKIKHFIVDGDDNKVIRDSWHEVNEGQNFSNIYIRTKEDAKHLDKGSIIAYVPGKPRLKKLITFMIVDPASMTISAESEWNNLQKKELYDYEYDYTEDKVPGDQKPPKAPQKAWFIPSGSKFKVDFYFPQDLSKFVFPIDFRFFTDDFVPEGGQGFLSMINQRNPLGKTYFKYTLKEFRDLEQVPGKGYRKTVHFVASKNIKYDRLTKGDLSIRIQTQPKDLFTAGDGLERRTLHYDKAEVSLSNDDYVYLNINVKEN